MFDIMRLKHKLCKSYDTILKEPKSEILNIKGTRKNG